MDPRGALEDEEEEEEGGDDWEDISEREGRFDMVMNMIPGILDMVTSWAQINLMQCSIS